MSLLKLPGADARNEIILNDLRSDTARYIFKTVYFTKALTQTHHNKTTVALHILGVTATCLRIYYFLMFLGWKLDKECLLKAALCHDFGIIDRYEKFENNLVCYRQHPSDSAVIARKLFPDLDLRTEYCIRHHMYPCLIRPSYYPEGIILSLADKYCAVIEGTIGAGYCPGMLFINEIFA